LSQNGATPSQESEPASAPAGVEILEELLSALKQPLASIRAAAEILRDNPDLPADLRARFHAVVIADGERLNRLIDACFQEVSVDVGAGRLSLPIPGTNTTRDG
jgi:nitrogen-specific signal transduction histidine kinase